MSILDSNLDVKLPELRDLCSHININDNPRQTSYCRENLRWMLTHYKPKVFKFERMIRQYAQYCSRLMRSRLKQYTNFRTDIKFGTTATNDHFAEIGVFGSNNDTYDRILTIIIMK